MIKIAICDDEAPTRAYLTDLIRAQSRPCEIVEYARAEDYLADSREIDLLFLDIELRANSPDGMALARRIRETASGPQPVIIFVTGHARQYMGYVPGGGHWGGWEYLQCLFL